MNDLFKENENNVLTLYQLNLLIKEVIDVSFLGKNWWVKAEIHKLNLYKQSGHAYPELLEKKDNEVVCQMRGIIWKNDFLRINQKFIETTGEPLKDNINVLMYVSVQFEPRYGLSLRIRDIDPNYTLGELEKYKKQTIERLKKEGIFDKNKQLSLALVPQRIAVISVETSKGYNDLITTFQKFSYKYQILYDLYPSLLQGEEAAANIRFQLENIKTHSSIYDAVLIIRGGGGEVGLSCYNDYELCKAIALFPIPVITGIGHSTNFTIAEMVAYQNGITPTDTAMIIIQRFQQFEQTILELQQALIQHTKNFILSQQHFVQQMSQEVSLQAKELFHQQKLLLQEFEQIIKNTPKSIFRKQEHKLIQKAHQLKHFATQIISYQEKYIQSVQQNLLFSTEKIFTQEHQKIKNYQSKIIQRSQHFLIMKNVHLRNLEKNIQLLHPDNILKRGYSIVFDNQNKTISSANELSEAQDIKIKFYQSEANFKITQLKIKNYEK
jgi:exodeoxyribonuclease VII large subunit